VILERGVDDELDDRGRGDLQVLDGLAGQLPELAGPDGGRPGVAIRQMLPRFALDG
jgi:hypothetical protein